MSANSVVQLLNENRTPTNDPNKAVFYKAPKQRAYRMRTDGGDLTKGYRNLLREGRVPTPEGFRVAPSGRVVKTSPSDTIVIRRLTADMAQTYGIPTKRELVNFLAARARRGQPITKFSQLREAYKRTARTSRLDTSNISAATERKRRLQEDLSRIQVVERKQSGNLKIKVNVYQLNLRRDIQKDDDVPDITTILQFLVQETIRRENLQGADRVQIHFESETLHKGGTSSPYVMVDDVATLIPIAIEDLQKKLQSAESLANVTVSVNTIDVPQGRGRSTKAISILERGGVFSVRTQSHCGFISLALTKPIHTMLGFSQKILEKDQRRDKARFKAGLEVMARCGIPEEQEICDYENLCRAAETFGVCVHVYDIHSRKWLRTPNVHAVENDDDSHVYLLKDGNHFDAIIRPKVWFEKDYICHVCEVGYSHQHVCEKSNHVHKTPRVANKQKDTHCRFCKIKKDGYHRCCPNCLTDISKDGHKHKCFMTRGRVKVLNKVPDNTKATLLRTEDDGRQIWDIHDLRVSEKYILLDTEAMTMPEHVNNCLVAWYMFEDKQYRFDNLDDLMDWLFSKTTNEKGKEAFTHDGYTVLAHYGSGYDFKFMYEHILTKTQLSPYTIMDGSKITYMKIAEKINLRFVDTFKFFLTSLDKLPKMFGFSELKKGFFPHRFNTPENQLYVGPYPDVEYYSPDEMKEDKRKAFLEWYATKEGETFDFQKELLEYCISDVDILRRACIALRSFFLETEGLDPFQYTTLPGCTLALFRANHMPQQTIGVFDSGSDNQSRIALEWLAYREIVDKQKIHTVREGREAWIHVERGDDIKPKKVDGLHGKEVYEFSGCFHHGCPKCFPGRTKKYDKTIQDNREIVEEGYTLHHIWQCEWEAMKKDEEVQKVLKVVNDTLSIDPRDAFFGGRTDALKTYFDIGKAPRKLRIFYKDITSLYPWVNFNCEYPVGHPEIIRSGFDESLKSYFGLVKCTVQPPTNLYHPVLARKMGGKLVFDLGGPNNLPFTGTWTTMELTKAMTMGYKILKIHEVQHFKESTSSIFQTYVGRFLKIKQEASGYPSWVQTEEDKDKYIRDYHERQGILLDKSKIEKNEGLRAFAKLCLNNLWGRFGMRHFRDQRQIVRTHNEVLDILTNPKLVPESLNFTLFNDIDQALASYEVMDNDRDSMYTTNIYIAIFTTSWARLQLYKALETLGERVLYMDTDSVVYYHEDDSDHGLDEGDLLGQWTDEMDGHWAETWVSGGPKNYGYKLAVKPGCKPDCKKCGSTVCKVKGFSLNYANSQVVNVDTLQVAVKRACMVPDAPQAGKDMVVSNFRIRYDPKTRAMVSKTEDKLWSYQVDKRQQRCAYDWMVDTVPYGFYEQ